MSMSTKPATQTPTSLKSGKQIQRSSGNQFVLMALAMSWKLALVVMIPVIGGALLDRRLDSFHVFLFVGLAVAVLGSVLVMWQAMQAANRLPVPKLTAAEKRKIQKQYETDDADD